MPHNIEIVIDQQELIITEEVTNIDIVENSPTVEIIQPPHNIEILEQENSIEVTEQIFETEVVQENVTVEVQSVGAQGPQGPEGPEGPQGIPGPNEVTTSTTTNITGILKGDGSNVSAATPDVDYQTPIGYTPEDVANKVTDLSTPNDTTYPTTEAVAEALVALPQVDEKVKVSASDSIPNYLNEKLDLASSGTGLGLNIDDPGGEETLEVFLDVDNLISSLAIEGSDSMAIHDASLGSSRKVTLSLAKEFFVPEIKSGTVTLPAFGAINIETVNLQSGGPYKLFLRIYSNTFQEYRSMEITLQQTGFSTYDFVVDNLVQDSSFDVQFQPAGSIFSLSLFVQSSYSREVTVSYVRIFHA